jgi:hypothetical protein
LFEATVTCQKQSSSQVQYFALLSAIFETEKSVLPAMTEPLPRAASAFFGQQLRAFAIGPTIPSERDPVSLDW